MRRVSASCPRVIPRGLFVTLRLGVKAGEHTIRVGGQLEIVFDDERSVGVGDQGIFGEAVVLDGIMNETAGETHVPPGPDLAEEVGDRGRAPERPINPRYLCVYR